MSNTLFPELNAATPRQKKAKLGRYERIQRELAADIRDTHKKFVDVHSSPTPLHPFYFVDLFCGAGGMTQGMSQAGLHPVASVEISPIASATHVRNFRQCRHWCGDIERFDPLEWVSQAGIGQVHLVVGGPPLPGVLSGR